MQAAAHAWTNNALLRWMAYLAIAVVAVIAIFQLQKAELLPLPKLFDGMVVSPLSEMWGRPMDLLQTLIDGSTVGIMYSLVALGFALIFKASGTFNFAQGIMVVFAVFFLIAFDKMPYHWLLIGASVAVAGTLAIGLALRRLGVATAAYIAVVAAVALAAGRFYSVAFQVGAAVVVAAPLAWAVHQKTVSRVGGAGYFIAGMFAVAASAAWGPIFVALFLVIFVMFLLAVTVERLVLRPLIGQPELILFMATIGLFFFLEGFGETLFGGQSISVPDVALGIPQGPIHFWGGNLKGGITLQKLDLIAAAASGLMVAVLAFMFQKLPVGRALRAVADDHQAALTVGIPLSVIWIVVWTVAGVVALVTGIFWGISGGAVDFSLAIIALKALPVLILGGFTSVPGVIVGGFIIGIGEKVAELYWGDLLGGGIEEWFAYALALFILLFRPQGLFGEKIIERV